MQEIAVLNDIEEKQYKIKALRACLHGVGDPGLVG